MNPPIPYSPLQFHAPAHSKLVAANAILPPGNLVALGAHGHAVLAADVAGLVVAGVATGSPPHPGNDRETVDNTDRPAGTHNKVFIKTGIYRFPNSSAAPVTASDLGKPVYVEDERTVAKITSNSIVAGVALGLESTTHVWIFAGPVGTLPGSPTLGSVPPATTPDSSSASSPVSGGA